MKPECKKTTVSRCRNNDGVSAFDLSRLKQALDASDHTTTDNKVLPAPASTSASVPVTANSDAGKIEKKSSFDLSALSSAISAVGRKVNRKRRIRRRKREMMKKLEEEATRSLEELLLLPADSGVLHMDAWISGLIKSAKAVTETVQIFSEPVETFWEPETITRLYAFR